MKNTHLEQHRERIEAAEAQVQTYLDAIEDILEDIEEITDLSITRIRTGDTICLFRHDLRGGIHPKSVTFEFKLPSKSLEEKDPF